MKISKQSVIAVIAGLAMVTSAGCSTPDATETDADTQTGEINLYSSRHYDTDDALYEEFTEQTGIKVNLIEGKASELIERIKNEGENSPADVLITVDVGNLWRAQEEGLLQTVDSAVLESTIPANLRSEEGYWFGLSKRARVIIYNKDKVNPEELSTYEALGESPWQGRVCIRSSSNIYNQSLVASKIAEKGAEEAETWVAGVVNNFAREPEGNDTAQIKAVASGECDVAIANHYYFVRLNQSDKPEDQEVASKVGLFFPNQDEGGTHINISGAAVPANAPNSESAVKFIEYLVSPEAQSIFADGNNEFAIVETAKKNPALEDLGEFQESSLDIEAYGKENSEAVKVMDRAGWK